MITVDIPRPPSVNRLVGKLGNVSPRVVRWHEQADKHVLLQRLKPHLLTISGPFDLAVVFPEYRFGEFDLDNPLKPLLDWMQSREFVVNDRWCRHLDVAWGFAPEGCRIRVKPWEASA